MIEKGGDENGFGHIDRFHGRRDGRERNGFVPLQRFLTRQQKKEEQRDAVKTKETVLLFQSLKALGKLSVANSIALRDGRTNGELAAALREFEEAERQMYDYLVSSHAENYSG